MTSILVPLAPTDIPVIAGGGVDEASAVNITTDLVTKLAVHDQVYIGPGWFEIDPDAVAWTTTKHVIGAGSWLTSIKFQGAGRCFDSAGPGSLVKGMTIWDSTVGKVGTGVYVDAPALTERQQIVEDVLTYGLAAGVHLHGNKAYYWRLSDCALRNGTVGLLTTDDLATEGPNRGLAFNLLVEDNDIGADFQGGNTIELYGFRSADEGTGIRSAVDFLRCIGGTFENYTANAIEVVAGAKRNEFLNFSKNDAATILDAGTDSVFTPTRGARTYNGRLMLDQDTTSQSTVYESWVPGNALPRYKRLISGRQEWNNGTFAAAVLDQLNLEMSGSSRWNLNQMQAGQQTVTPVAGAITPDLDRLLGQELKVDVLTANLTINNPVNWPDGLEVKLYLEADAGGSAYQLTWGSQYNGCPGVVYPENCGWLTLKRRSATRIDCIGGNLDLNV